MITSASICEKLTMIVTTSVVNYIMESLILAQNERWRRVLSMQVERDLRCLHLGESGERVSNA